MNKRHPILFPLVFIILHSSFRICSAGCVIQAQPAVAATGLVVTQFAVPVAVPQYAVPVAPQSFVQYGGSAVMPQSAAQQSTSSNDTVEDRIAAKILARLTSAGVIKPEALPSVVSKACVQCHGGPVPKAGLDLSDVRRIGPDERLAAINRITADDAAKRMPPAGSGVKLTPEEAGRLLHEISSAPYAAQSPAPVPRQPAPAPAPAKQ